MYEYAYGNECFVATNVFSQGGEIVEQIRPNIRTAQGGLGCPDQAIKVNQDNKSQSITECSTKIYFSNIIRIFFCHIS